MKHMKFDLVTNECDPWSSDNKQSEEGLSNKFDFPAKKGLLRVLSDK